MGRKSDFATSFNAHIHTVTVLVLCVCRSAHVNSAVLRIESSFENGGTSRNDGMPENDGTPENA